MMSGREKEPLDKGCGGAGVHGERWEMGMKKGGGLE